MIKASNATRFGSYGARLIALIGILCWHTSGATGPTSARTNAVSVEPAPSTPREFFNAGTRRLREGKLREAEAFLESALNSQIQNLQPSALYNLGEVRFNQGIEELKK